MADQDEIIKVTLRISRTLHRRVEEVRSRRTPPITQVDLWREAMGKLISSEEDIIGSRAHFQRTLQTRLEEWTDRLENRIPEISADLVAVDLDKVDQELITVRRLIEALLLLEAVQWTRVGNKDATSTSVQHLLDQALNAANEGKFGLSSFEADQFR